MSIRQAKPMTYYSRNQRQNPAVVKPVTPLIPRESFDGHDEVLAAYDLMLTYNEAHRSHSREAKSKEAAAETASQDYKAAVAQALAAGVDPSKIANREPQLRAEAEAHRGFASDATNRAAAHGVLLGRLMAQAAPACFGAAEESLSDSSEDIHAALNSLTAAWSKWSHAWAVRTKLSQLAVVGGQQSGFSPQDQPPAEVAAAIRAIEDQVANLDRLKADEAEMTRWREEQAAADASNARSYARPNPTA